MKVRLETRAAMVEHRDLWFGIRISGSRGARTQVLCTGLRVTVEGEAFALPSQGAQDIRPYDVMKDTARFSRIVAARVTNNGAVVTVTSDPS